MPAAPLFNTSATLHTNTVALPMLLLSAYRFSRSSCHGHCQRPLDIQSRLASPRFASPPPARPPAVWTNIRRAALFSRCRRSTTSDTRANRRRGKHAYACRLLNYGKCSLQKIQTITRRITHPGTGRRLRRPGEETYLE